MSLIARILWGVCLLVGISLYASLAQHIDVHGLTRNGLGVLAAVLILAGLEGLHRHWRHR